ncbi:MAG: SRPBCC domain-containing protein [Gemmatimonadaceae bacterium]|nr:SRPBCC domain-containing protein [Gemmatimonadaceae bacterium]
MSAGNEAAVDLEIELASTPEKVWRALTDPALVSEWLLPVVGLNIELGAAFQLRTDPRPGWDGTINCRILEIEPLRKLSYTWVVADERGLDTVVTFTLRPTATGTLLSLAHTGFVLPGQRGALGGTRYGWNLMTTRLIDTLARTT